MRKVLGALSLMSAGLLAVTQPTLAQTTQADVDAAPTSGALGLPSAGDSSLIVSIWSPTLPLSLVFNTGMSYSQMQQADITPETGLTLDFGQIPEWNALAGATDLVYHVFAGDGSGNAVAREVLTTAALGSSFTAVNADVNGVTGSSAAGNFFGAYNLITNCTASNVCLDTDGLDAQTLSWDVSYSGQLPVSAAGAVGTALGFYSIVGGNPAAQAQAPATVSVFQNLTGLGQWLLSAGGQLTYTIPGGGPVVPLPAAVWLLVSGLAGFGAISRRRSAA